jgi:hypothetical protein
MPTVKKALERVLRERRAAFNAKFRREGRGVEPAAMSEYLARTVDPLVAAVRSEAAEEVTEALFDFGVVALKRGLVSGRGAPTELEAELSARLPRFSAHLEADPRRLLTALGNGWVRIARDIGAASARAWLADLDVAAPACHGEALYDAGLVLAWRHGLSEAREAALERAARLPAALCERLLGVRDPETRLERRFARSAAGRLGPLSILARAGGFTAFGGCFARPPRVVAAGQRLFASDGMATRELFADCFGARLVPAEIAAAPAALPSPAEALKAFPALSDTTSCAAAPGMTAVTLASSHYVFVLGHPEVRA